MNILSQNYVFVKTIILSITCPKAYHCESNEVRCFHISKVLAVLFTVYVSERNFDNRPVFVARPNFSAVHFDYFLRESKPYAGISLFARVKPFENVREIVLVNAVAVVGNRDYRFVVFVFASNRHSRFAVFERVGYEI